LIAGLRVTVWDPGSLIGISSVFLCRFEGSTDDAWDFLLLLKYSPPGIGLRMSRLKKYTLIPDCPWSAATMIPLMVSFHCGSVYPSTVRYHSEFVDTVTLEFFSTEDIVLDVDRHIMGPVAGACERHFYKMFFFQSFARSYLSQLVCILSS